MKGEYEVGYGKPPKATRFGNRPQPDRSSKPGPTRRAAIGLAAVTNGLMAVTHNGRVVRMHPHEAMLHGLAKNGLRGKQSAIKAFLVECKKAGLLEGPPAQQTSGSIFVPKGAYRVSHPPYQNRRLAALGR